MFRASTLRFATLAPACWLLLCAAAPAGAAPVEPPALAGIPVDFILFALTLIGIALFHRHTLPIALTGLIVISLWKMGFSPFPEGPGFPGWVAHLGHEWVMLTNLLGLLLGFALLSKPFEASHVPEWLPRFLPADWKGALVLLVMISWIGHPFGLLWLGLPAALILEPVDPFPEERVVFCAEYLMLVKCLLAYP